MQGDGLPGQRRPMPWPSMPLATSCAPDISPSGESSSPALRLGAVRSRQTGMRPPPQPQPDTSAQLNFNVKIQKALLAENQLRFSHSFEASASSERRASLLLALPPVPEGASSSPGHQELPSMRRPSGRTRFAAWKASVESAMERDDVPAFEQLLFGSAAEGFGFGGEKLAAAFGGGAEEDKRESFEMPLRDFCSDQTLLHRAAGFAAVNVCLSLVEQHAASPRAQNADGELPIHLLLGSPRLAALPAGSQALLPRVMELLSLSGSRRVTECANAEGLTPFHVAATSVSLPAVKALLACCTTNLSSVMRQRDRQGRTPLERGLCLGAVPEVVFELGASQLQMPMGALDETAFLDLFLIATKSHNFAMVDHCYRVRHPGRPLLHALNNPFELVAADCQQFVKLFVDSAATGSPLSFDMEAFFHTALPCLAPAGAFLQLLAASSAKKLKRQITQRSPMRKRLQNILHQLLNASGPELSAAAAAQLPSLFGSVLKQDALQQLALRPPSRGPIHDQHPAASFSLSALLRFSPIGICRHLTILARYLLEQIYPESLLRYLAVERGGSFHGDRSHLNALHDYMHFERQLRHWVLATALSSASPDHLVKYLGRFCLIALSCLQTGNFLGFYALAQALNHPRILPLLAQLAAKQQQPLPFEKDLELVNTHLARFSSFQDYARIRHSNQKTASPNYSLPILSFVFQELTHMISVSTLYLFDAPPAPPVLNFSLSLRLYRFLQAELLSLKSSAHSSFSFEADVMAFVTRALDGTLLPQDPEQSSPLWDSLSAQILSSPASSSTEPEDAPISTSIITFDKTPPTPSQRDINYAFKALFVWRSKAKLDPGTALLQNLKPAGFFLERVSTSWAANSPAGKPIVWASIFRSYLIASRKLISPPDFAWLTRFFDELSTQIQDLPPASRANLYYCAKCPAVCACVSSKSPEQQRHPSLQSPQPHPSQQAVSLQSPSISSPAPSLPQPQPQSSGRKHFPIDSLRSLAEFCKTREVDPQSSLIGLRASAKTLGFLHISSPVTKVSDGLNLNQEQICDLILLWNKLENAETLRQQVSEFSELIQRSRRKWDAGTLVVINPNPEDPSSPFIFARITAMLDKDVMVNIDPAEGSRGILRMEKSAAIPISSSLLDLVRTVVPSEIRKLVHSALDVFNAQLIEDRDTSLHKMLRSQRIDVTPILHLLLPSKPSPSPSLTMYSTIQNLQNSLFTIRQSLALPPLAHQLNHLDKQLCARAAGFLPELSQLYLPSLHEDTQRLATTLAGKFSEAGILELIHSVDNLSRLVSEKLENMLKGSTKRELTTWWHTTMKKRVYKFLSGHGYQVNCIPYNYTEERPADINAVQSQAVLLAEVLNFRVDLYGFRPFLEDLVDAIHERISGFMVELRAALCILTGINTFSKERIEAWLQERSEGAGADQADARQAVKDLFEDYLYLMEMKSMDDVWKNGKTPTATKLQLTQVVPISGLAVGVVIRLEQEVATVLELWG